MERVDLSEFLLLLLSKDSDSGDIVFKGVKERQIILESRKECSLKTLRKKIGKILLSIYVKEYLKHSNYHKSWLCEPSLLDGYASSTFLAVYGDHKHHTLNIRNR